jgi:phosphatidylinositol alpha 1,6-mannosyltransferase
MTTLRILIGAETYPPDVNGAARFAGHLATGLAARGHDVHVVAPSTTGPAGVETHDGVTLHRITSTRYPSLSALQVGVPWRAGAEVARIMEEVDPDVVHTNGHVVVGRAVVDAARRSGWPLVATNHLMPENLVGYLPIPAVLRGAVGRAMWNDLGRVYAHAGVVTAPTPRAVELLERRAGISGALAVSNGIDTELYRTGPRSTSEVPTVLFVGRLDQEKRVDDLVRAVASLPRDLPVRLEVVGDGARRREWADLASNLGLDGRAVFHGRLTDEEVRDAYARADIFCMPSVAELQSLATLEAMAAGLPVVAADAMALPHLVRPGENGRLYRPGLVPELAGHLRDLLVDPSLRVGYGARSLEIVQTHALAETLDVFEALYVSELAYALDPVPRVPVSTRRSLVRRVRSGSDHLVRLRRDRMPVR